MTEIELTEEQKEKVTNTANKAAEALVNEFIRQSVILIGGEGWADELNHHAFHVMDVLLGRLKHISKRHRNKILKYMERDYRRK